MFKKRELIQFSKDRLLSLLLLALFFGSLMLLVLTLIKVHVTDVLVPIRHSSYGNQSIYTDKWYNLFSFGIFGLIVFVINGYLAIKLRTSRRGLSMGVLSVSIFVMLIGLIVTWQVLKLVNFNT